MKIVELPSNDTASTQTDEPKVHDNAIQTDADLGMKESPLSLDDDDDLLDDHSTVSDDEET